MFVDKDTEIVFLNKHNIFYEDTQMRNVKTLDTNLLYNFFFFLFELYMHILTSTEVDPNYSRVNSLRFQSTVHSVHVYSPRDRN